MTSVDFTAYFHPVSAVECPDCKASRGTHCRRPSGHRAAAFHASRCKAADALFIAVHGAEAWIERLPGDRWQVHLTGCAADPAERSADPSSKNVGRQNADAQLSMGF